MGNPIVVVDRPGPGPPSQVRTDVRFGLGLVGLFLSSTLAVLLLLAVVPAALPGWQSTIVSSGSMQPAIRRGDVVVVRKTAMERIREGSVVVVAEASGGTLVHRVFQVRDGSVVTKGDANSAPDSGQVEPSAVHGVGAALVPWVGLPRLWWDERDLVRLGSVGLITMLALAVSQWAWIDPSDPWRRSSSQRTCWLAVPAPVTETRLLPASARRSMLERARSCG